MARGNHSVVLFEVESWQQDYLKDRLPKLALRFFPGVLDEQSASQVSDAEVVSVFIRSRVSREVLNRLPKLRFIATRSTGFDHIDVEAAKERGILVSNVPGYGENTVAEHTSGLILSLSRKILQAYRRVQEGQLSLEGLMGFDLKGETLGVVGAGRIGLHVIRIARGYDMNVLACDVRPLRLLAEVLGFDYVPLEELLRRSDIVTLHTPLLPQDPPSDEPGAFRADEARLPARQHRPWGPGGYCRPALGSGRGHPGWGWARRGRGRGAGCRGAAAAGFAWGG